MVRAVGENYNLQPRIPTVFASIRRTDSCVIKTEIFNMQYMNALAVAATSTYLQANSKTIEYEFSSEVWWLLLPMPFIKSL